MKKRIPIAFKHSDKIISRLSSLFLCLILATNISGQKVDTLLIDTWVSSNWQRTSKQIFNYDGSGFLINTRNQTWDIPSTTWKDISQSNYTNNLDGTASVVTTQSWSGSQWNDVSRTTYTYNVSKKVLTATTEIWLVVMWQNLSMQTNTYDGSGFLITDLSQTWDGVSAWKNSQRIKYKNNVNGTVNVDTTQVWDGISTWKNSERSTFTYNGANKVVTETTDTLRSGNWEAYSLITNTYSGNNLTNTLEQQWDKNSSTYKNESQSNFTNNVDGTPSVIVNQLWDNGSSLWNNSTRLTYKYSTATLSPQLYTKEDITIYPNPAGDVITIKGNISIHGSSYSITDQSGKLVLRGRLINENSTIDVSTLANGIYFLQLGERSRHSFKVIKY
jgi:hypothetical protein